MQYAQINIFAILVLTLLLWSFHHKRDERFLADQRLFEWMFVVNIVILIFDSATGILDGALFPGARMLNRIATACFYALNPVMGCLYLFYCECKIGVPREETRRRALWYAAPVFVHLALTIGSQFTPLLYWLDENNIYRRGPVFFLSMGLSYWTVLYALFEVLRAIPRDSAPYRRRTCASLLLFPVPPLLGGLAQIWLGEMSVVWVSSTLSMLIVFINVQNAQVTSDSLTGLFHRGQIAPYLRWKTRRIAPGHSLYLLMLDLDDFKSVNDRFGHLTGNDALIRAAQCLAEACARDDFLARYGGDEFVLVAQRRDDAEITSLIRAIHARTDAITDAPYRLRFSIGCARWQIGDTVDSYLEQADTRMYAAKARKPSL